MEDPLVIAFLDRFFRAETQEERDALIFEAPYGIPIALAPMARALLEGPPAERALTGRYHAIVWALLYLEQNENYRSYYDHDLPRLNRIAARVRNGKTHKEARAMESNESKRSLLDPPCVWSSNEDPCEYDSDFHQLLLRDEGKQHPFDRLLRLLEERNEQNVTRLFHFVLEAHLEEVVPTFREQLDLWLWCDPERRFLTIERREEGSSSLFSVIEHVRELFENGARFEQLLPLARQRVAQQREDLQSIDPRYAKWFDALPEDFDNETLSEETVLLLLRHPERWVHERLYHMNYDFTPAVLDAMSKSLCPKVRRLASDSTE